MTNDVFNYAALNPIYTDLGAPNAYATFLPALTSAYMDYASCDFTSTKRPLPEEIKTNPQYFNFLSCPDAGFYYNSALVAPIHLMRNYKEIPCSFIDARAENTFLMADNGAYSFKGNNTHWTIENLPRLREVVLPFQHRVANSAATFDIPSECIKVGKIESIDRIIELVVENHEYYQVNIPKESKVLWLNTLQGESYSDLNKYYEAVRKFKYAKGWGIPLRPLIDGRGNSAGMLGLGIVLLDLYHRGDLDECPHLHVFGTGHLRAAVGLTLFQRAVRKHFGLKNFVITYDSTNPFVEPLAHGRIPLNFRLSQTDMTIDFGPSPDHPRFIGDQTAFPSVISRTGRVSQIGHFCVKENPKRPDRSWDSISYLLAMHHSLEIYLLAIAQTNRLHDCATNNDKLYEFPREYAEISAVIDRAFSASRHSNAISLLEKNADVLSYMDQQNVFTKQMLIDGYCPNYAVDGADESEDWDENVRLLDDKW